MYRSQKEKEMFKSDRRYSFLPLILLAAGLTPSSNVFAESCKDVHITINNQTEDELKVKKFEFHSVDKGWKTEVGMFGVDGFQKLMPGHNQMWTRGLGDVGDKNTRFRVTYAHHHGGSKWDDNLTQTTENFTCSDDLKETVTLTK
jgi:hypothetical protein